MRILGIDYGTKRIGLALSDKTGNFAFPLSVISAMSDVAPEIKKICDENKVGKIVLGRPAGYKGDAGKILQKIEKFKKELEKSTGLPIVYENEVLTTQQARREQGDVRKIDASAAAIILQSYLDRENNSCKGLFLL